MNTKGCCSNSATDLSQRISSHRTSQGYLVYYRCDCGATGMSMLRWCLEPTSGTTRLR
jgi:hypothetical protein